MTKFKVIVEGGNRVLEIEGAPRVCGFFATRIMEGDDGGRAAQRAVESIRDEIKGRVMNPPPDEPWLEVSEVVELSEASHPVELPKGFTWYLEEGH